jgi:hypothetical protein
MRVIQAIRNFFQPPYGGILTLAVVVCATCAGTARAGDYSTWAKYRTVTVNTTGVTSAAVKKIPLALRFNVANQFDMFTGVTAALAGGADIRVTKQDGTTDVPFEIESWVTGASGYGVLWVLLDSVPANSATAYGLRVYWNKAAVTTLSSPATVFDTANGFLAVWHFNQAAGSPLLDATRNNNTATPGAATAAPADNAASLLGMGKSFDGATQFYQVGTGATALNLNTDTGPHTITGWANATSCAARIAVIAKYSNSNDIAGGRQYALHTANTTTTWRFTNDPTSLSTAGDNGGEYTADAADACVDGSWTYLAGRYNSNGNAPTADATGAANASLIVNGNAAITGAAANVTGTSIGTTSSTFIGKIATEERYMNGTLDEVTVSKVERSVDWLKLSYETQKPNPTAVVIASLSTPPTALLPGLRSLPGFGIHAIGSTIVFKIPAGVTGAKVSVMDISGREVWSRNVSSATREVAWNGIKASGLYVARTVVTSGETAAESKLLLP